MADPLSESEIIFREVCSGEYTHEVPIYLSVLAAFEEGQTAASANTSATEDYVAILQGLGTVRG